MNATVRTGAFGTKKGSLLLDELKTGRRVDEVSPLLWQELAQMLNTRLDASQCVARLCNDVLRFNTLDDEFASIERIREALHQPEDPPEERAATHPRRTRASVKDRVDHAKSEVASVADSVFSRQTFVRSINERRMDHS